MILIVGDMRRNFQRRRKIESFQKNATRIGLVILLLVLINSVFGLYKKDRVAKEAYREVGEKIVEVEERKEALLVDIDRLSTERGIEEELRSTYQVALPEEEVVVIFNDENESSDDESKSGVWESIKAFFGF